MGKVQTDNRALTSLTGAEDWIHIDGSVTTPVTRVTGGGRLLRVILNTNGAVLRIRNGSEVIAVIATDAPEQTFNYGLYFNGNLITEASGALSATLVVDNL